MVIEERERERVCELLATSEFMVSRKNSEYWEKEGQ